MGILAGALVVGALVLFLTSTRQIGLGWRLIIWCAAAALLAAAAILNVGEQSSTGLLSTLLRHPAIVGEALRGNLGGVQASIVPAIDILVVLATLLGVGCLIAMTPGEAIERVIRPINVGLIGAVIGGAIVFTVSAVGFGGVSKRHVLLSYVEENDVIDGDTLRMGDVSLRLLGIDAPEDHQICLDAKNAPFDCGAQATDALRKLIAGGLVYCHPPFRSVGLQLKESFGRPLVICESAHQSYGALRDVGRELVRLGYADVYRSTDGTIDSDYTAENEAATRSRSGFHEGAFLPPTLWRNDTDAKCALLGKADPEPAWPQVVLEERTRLEDQIKRLRKACNPPPRPDDN